MYAVIHGICSYEFTERILVPQFIFLAASLLPGFGLLIGGLWQDFYSANRCMPTIMPYLGNFFPAFIYTAISAGVAAFTKDKLERRK